MDAFRPFGAWRDIEKRGLSADFPRRSSPDARFRRFWTSVPVAGVKRPIGGQGRTPCQPTADTTPPCFIRNAPQSRVPHSGTPEPIHPFCPTSSINGIDLGRYPPTGGRNASKISQGCCRYRIKRTPSCPTSPPSVRICRHLSGICYPDGCGANPSAYWSIAISGRVNSAKVSSPG